MHVQIPPPSMCSFEKLRYLSTTSWYEATPASLYYPTQRDLDVKLRRVVNPTLLQLYPWELHCVQHRSGNVFSYVSFLY